MIHPYIKSQITKRIEKANTRSSRFRGVSKNGIKWQVIKILITLLIGLIRKHTQ